MFKNVSNLSFFLRMGELKKFEQSPVFGYPLVIKQIVMQRGKRRVKWTP